MAIVFLYIETLITISGNEAASRCHKEVLVWLVSNNNNRAHGKKDYI